MSLRQQGVRLEGGRQYTLSLWARAETAREIRVSVSSAAGASYLTRTVPVTTAWTAVAFPFTAPLTDANATLEIALGRSDVSVWIDTVSFRPATVR